MFGRQGRRGANRTVAWRPRWKSVCAGVRGSGCSVLAQPTESSIVSTTVGLAETVQAPGLPQGLLRMRGAGPERGAELRGGDAVPQPLAESEDRGAGAAGAGPEAECGAMRAVGAGDGGHSVPQAQYVAGPGGEATAAAGRPGGRLYVLYLFRGDCKGGLGAALEGEEEELRGTGGRLTGTE